MDLQVFVEGNRDQFKSMIGFLCCRTFFIQLKFKYIHFYIFAAWDVHLAAYTVFGIPQTINCANYMYFKCMQRVTELGEPRAVLAFTGLSFLWALLILITLLYLILLVFLM